MKTKIKVAAIFAGLSLLSCNQSQNAAPQTTPEGTTVTNRVNSDMEPHRTSADVDTIASPGSNSYDLNSTNSGATGQDGMDTQAGTGGQGSQPADNGTGR